jgi:ubiquitin-protein ligase
VVPQPRPQRIITPAAHVPSSPAGPTAAQPLHVAPAAGRGPGMRIRRLGADAEQMLRVFRSSPIMFVRPIAGSPPDTYNIEYRVRGLERGAGGKPVVRAQHVVEIQLTNEYPRQAPKSRILTPIFHPNFDRSTICVADHWTAAERLVDLVVRIGEMIAYQSYNIKSPLDGEAAMWADLNRKDLPVDRREMRPAQMD